MLASCKLYLRVLLVLLMLTFAWADHGAPAPQLVGTVLFVDPSSVQVRLEAEILPPAVAEQVLAEMQVRLERRPLPHRLRYRVRVRVAGARGPFFRPGDIPGVSGSFVYLCQRSAGRVIRAERRSRYHATRKAVHGLGERHFPGADPRCDSDTPRHSRSGRVRSTRACVVGGQQRSVRQLFAFRRARVSPRRAARLVRQLPRGKGAKLEPVPSHATPNRSATVAPTSAKLALVSRSLASISGL